jgi:diaminopimelate epimerase
MVMEDIEFYKMSGAGNDFILVDNRTDVFTFSDVALAVAKLCKRRISIGADGLILIERAAREGLDFAWRFYNSDGSEAAMCGNAARCAVRLSFLLGISGRKVSFLAGAGIVKGEVLRTGRVRIGMTDPTELSLDRAVSVNGTTISYDFATVGVPHAVVTVPDVDRVDVAGLGRSLRFHEAFSPEGTNVNFISVAEDNAVRIRTYERGVEGETLACGTGAAAAAVTAFLKGEVTPPVTVVPASGLTLAVDFRPGEGRVTELSLEGDARVVYRGKFNPEALD